MAHLPPAHRPRRRARRPTLRPRRSAHHPPRAPLRAPGRPTPDPARPPDQAALALWDYAARSAAWAPNNTTGDPLAEQIHAALAALPRRADPHPAPRPIAAQPPAERVEQALHTSPHRPRNPPPNAHRRTPRRDLDRRTRISPLTTLPLPGLRCQTASDGRAVKRAASAAAEGGAKPDLDSPTDGAITLQVRGGRPEHPFRALVVMSFGRNPRQHHSPA